MVIDFKTRPFIALANEAEQTIQAAESNLADYIIALQGYFRTQEDDFIDYYIRHRRKLSNIKPVNPDDLDADIRPINKKLQRFVDDYSWSKKRKDLKAILKYINHMTIPYGVMNATTLVNRVAKIKEKKEKISLTSTVQYINSPQFAVDAQENIRSKYRDFVKEVGQISKNIDAHTSELIYEQLYDGVEKLESMGELAVRVGSVFDECSQSRAMMIARTETMRSFNTATIDGYEAAQIKEAQILVAYDERTCDICSSLGGLIVPISEARNLLPLHPRCRCDWIVVIGKPLLSQPNTKDLELFVSKYPDLPASKISVLPRIPKFERGHFAGMSLGETEKILQDDALKLGVELSEEEAERIVHDVFKFSESSYADVRSAQRRFLETGKWDLYMQDEAKNIEKLIEYSPNYPKSKIMLRGIEKKGTAPISRQLAFEELKELGKDSIINMGGTSSWTTDIYTMRTHSGVGKNSVGFVLRGGSKNCASIRHISLHPKEYEILTSMKSKFKVQEKVVYGDLRKALSGSEIKEMQAIYAGTPLTETTKKFIETMGERWWVILEEI